MIFETRSDQAELIDDLALDEPALARNLRELEWVNRRLGGRRTLLHALDDIRRRHRNAFEKGRVTIADLGCGGGDLLAAVDAWAADRGVRVALTGIDANPAVVTYARERLRDVPSIALEVRDVLSPALDEQRFDIVCLNTFCHHFDDEALVGLWRRLAARTRLAIIVNDLHRHWIPYVAIVALSRALGLSHLARHDGPLSVRRAFRRRELATLFARAGIRDFAIRWRWPFRWQAIAWTSSAPTGR